MQLVMPFLMIPLVISFFWGLISPRSYGRFIGGLFLKVTNGGAPKEVAGLKILAQLIVGAIITAIFFSLHPATIFPIGFFWIMWFKKINQKSRRVQAQPSAGNTSDEAPTD
jgi:fatty acid desaturase